MPLWRRKKVGLPEPLRIHLEDWTSFVYPELGEAIRAAGARAFHLVLVPLGGFNRDQLSLLYVTFLHSLCLPDSYLMIHYAPFVGIESECLKAAEGLREMESYVRLEVLGKAELEPLGEWSGRSVQELSLRTNRRETLLALFESCGSLHFQYGMVWLLETKPEPFPIETLRRLNFGPSLKSRKGRDEWLKDHHRFLQEVLRDHAAVIEILEAHGPLVYTQGIPEERIVQAAQATAVDLRLPLVIDWKQASPVQQTKSPGSIPTRRS